MNSTLDGSDLFKAIRWLELVSRHKLALNLFNLLVTAPNVSYCESDVHRFKTSQVGLC